MPTMIECKDDKTVLHEPDIRHHYMHVPRGHMSARAKPVAYVSQVNVIYVRTWVNVTSHCCNTFELYYIKTLNDTEDQISYSTFYITFCRQFYTKQLVLHLMCIIYCKYRLIVLFPTHI